MIKNLTILERREVYRIRWTFGQQDLGKNLWWSLLQVTGAFFFKYLLGFLMIVCMFCFMHIFSMPQVCRIRELPAARRTHPTVCQRSSDPFYIVTNHKKWVTTSWTHGITIGEKNVFNNPCPSYNGCMVTNQQQHLYF